LEERGLLFGLFCELSNQVVISIFIKSCFSFHAFEQMYACGVQKETILVSSSSAMKFLFYAENGETEIGVGDNAILIFSENGTAGCEEFAK